MGDKNQTPQLGRCSSVPRINAAESSLKTRRIYRPEIWCYQPLRGIWFRLQPFTALVTSCAASAVRGQSCASLQTGHEHDQQTCLHGLCTTIGSVGEQLSYKQPSSVLGRSHHIICAYPSISATITI